MLGACWPQPQSRACQSLRVRRACRLWDQLMGWSGGEAAGTVLCKRWLPRHRLAWPLCRQAAPRARRGCAELGLGHNSKHIVNSSVRQGAAHISWELSL